MIASKISVTSRLQAHASSIAPTSDPGWSVAEQGFGFADKDVYGLMRRLLSSRLYLLSKTYSVLKMPVQQPRTGRHRMLFLRVRTAETIRTGNAIWTQASAMTFHACKYLNG
jgi:hypothetical protein